jgi:DNA (cytosine-5)-methyltransferase 1
VRGGIDVAAGIDLDASCRFAYEANNNAKFVHRNVRDLSARDVGSLFGGQTIRLLAGCAPCQPFSKYSRKSRTLQKDPKWNLLLDFARLVEAAQPELVTMENVPQLLDDRVFKRFLRSLAGYKVWWDVVDCTRYGIPQTRKRMVLLASRLGTVALLPPNAEHHVSTVREAIADLPRLEAGRSDPDDPLHTACRLSTVNLRRIRASSAGGTWRDWPPSLLSKCHRKKSGETYPSVYGRMEWDAPSPTMTTQCYAYGTGRFGHPDQDRAISLREAAILQTFPRTYRFIAEGVLPQFKSIGRLIGNAVPVRLGEVIAESLLTHVRSR